jgi:hypothetical protein
MRKTILTFGLISGAISITLMLVTTAFVDRIGFDRGYIVGYTSLVLSFLLVFFGIRSYRDNVGGGQITFGKAMAIGLGITAITCICYVVTWEALCYTVFPDFADKYAAYIIQKAKASGASDAVIQQKVKEMAEFKKMYANPFINAAMTLMEPLPVGVIMTLFSALILRKKSKPTPAPASMTQTA